MKYEIVICCALVLLSRRRCNASVAVIIKEKYFRVYRHYIHGIIGGMGARGILSQHSLMVLHS